jgi:hypothetical protein
MLACSISWTTVARLAGPVGARSVVSVLAKQQLLILNRLPATFPDLRLGDRVVAGMYAAHTYAAHTPEPARPSRHRSETLNAPAPPSSADHPEISPAALIHGAEEAGARRAPVGRSSLPS